MITRPLVRKGMPEENMVPDLVAAWARATPDALAIASGTATMTYAELDARATSIAADLRSFGVAPDVPVALLLPRSADLVVAALGIMKAGGAYVPLDPSYPEDRLAFMVRDAKPPVVVTESRFVSRLPIGDWRLLVLDGIETTPETLFDHARLTADHLAYVIYTSGSTGRPKGVQITHRGLSNLVSWHRDAFHITPADRATQHASPSFDAAVWEVWPY